MKAPFVRRQLRNRVQQPQRPAHGEPAPVPRSRTTVRRSVVPRLAPRPAAQAPQSTTARPVLSQTLTRRQPNCWRPKAAPPAHWTRKTNGRILHASTSAKAGSWRRFRHYEVSTGVNKNGRVDTEKGSVGFGFDASIGCLRGVQDKAWPNLPMYHAKWRAVSEAVALADAVTSVQLLCHISQWYVSCDRSWDRGS